MQLHFVLFYFFVCVLQKTFLFPKKSDRLQVVIVFSTSTFWNLWDEFNPETHFALGLNCMFFLLPEFFFCFIATSEVFALTWITHNSELFIVAAVVCTPTPGANNGKKIILSKFQESFHSSWKRLQSDVAVVVLSCCVIYFSDAGGRPCLQRDFTSLKKKKF